MSIGCNPRSTHNNLRVPIQRSAQGKQLSENDLLQYCRSLYHSETLPDAPTIEDIAAIKRKKSTQEKMADEYFRSLSASKIEGELRPILSKYPPGSDDYTSTAYTLALYGVNVPENMTKMAQIKDSIDINQATALDNLPYKLRKMYLSHPSDQALRTLYSVQGDGILAETLPQVRTQIFLNGPNHILDLASHHPETLQRLANDLAYQSVGEDQTMASAIQQSLRGATKPMDKSAVFMKLQNVQMLDDPKRIRKLTNEFEDIKGAPVNQQWGAFNHRKIGIALAANYCLQAIAQSKIITTPR